jgi:hypothetical protein
LTVAGSIGNLTSAASVAVLNAVSQPLPVAIAGGSRSVRHLDAVWSVAVDMISLRVVLSVMVVVLSSPAI